jgi:peroxiredoxin
VAAVGVVVGDGPLQNFSARSAVRGDAQRHVVATSVPA